MAGSERTRTTTTGNAVGRPAAAGPAAGATHAALANSAAVVKARQLGRLGYRGAPPAIDYKPRKAPWVPGKAVGSYVPGLTRKAFEKFGFATAQLVTDWADVAGRDMARYTLPERLRWPRAGLGGDGEDSGAGRGAATLTLRVDPARALDIEYKRAQLMERINVYFGYRAVAEIRIVQGAVEDRRQPAPGAITPRTGAGPARTPRHPASPPVALETVGDDSLRQALERMQAAIRARPSSAT